MKTRISTCSLLTVIFCCVLEYHETSAGVTLLLDSPVKGSSTKNTTTLLAQVKDANRNEIERTKAGLTKEKDVREAWRDERGDLVELRFLNEKPFSKESSLTKKYIQGTNDGAIENSVSVHTTPMVSYPKTSNRMQRTFWPFTSLFGYDYYSPPPPPGFGMFGSGLGGPFGGAGFGGPFEGAGFGGPFGGGGGFGPGFGGPFGGGGGFGSGFGGPFGPPPSLGLGFTFGL